MSDPALFALVLRLRTAAAGRIAPQVGQQVQAMFLDLVATVNPQLASELHDGQHLRSYTVAPLRLPRGPLRPGDGFDVRVTLLRFDLFGPLAHALLQRGPQSPLRLGNLPLVLDDVRGTPVHDPWAGFSGWDELATGAQASPHLALEFVTPTAISQSEDAPVAGEGRARPRVQLLPLPTTVFGSLVRRWDALAPEGLQLGLEAVEAAAKTALVADYNLHTVAVPMSGGTNKGFVGRVRYEVRGDTEQQRLLALLADAAFYLGVGAKTARGLGLCRRI